MEGINVQRLILVLVGLCARPLYCECGYKTRDKQQFITHIEQHPCQPGHIDYTTGAVSW